MADRLAPDLIAIDPRFGPLAEATRRLEAIPLDGLLTYLIDTAPAAYLPELIRQFHIAGMEGGALAATGAERRRLIREAIWLHRKKGTPWAVKRALELLGAEAEIIERGEARQRYLAHSPLRLDGAWRLDGAGHVLRPVDVLAGIPYLEHWAAFLVRLNLDLARSADMDAVRAAIREWAPVARHPVLFFWLAQSYRQPLNADCRALLDKRVCHPYGWPGATLAGCPARAWRLGRLPALDGRPPGFRLGAPETATGRIRARRAAGRARLVKAACARAFSAERLPSVGPRRLDGRWRLGACLRAGRFRLDGARLRHAGLVAPSRAATLSGRWRLGGPVSPLFEMRIVHV